MHVDDDVDDDDDDDNDSAQLAGFLSLISAVIILQLVTFKFTGIGVVHIIWVFTAV